MELDLYSEDFRQNRFAYYAQLHKVGPLHKLVKNECYLVVGYNIVQKVLTDHLSFLSQPMFQQDPILLGSDVPEHTNNRQVFNKSIPKMSRQYVYGCAENFEAIANFIFTANNSKKELRLLHDLVIPYTISTSLFAYGLRIREIDFMESSGMMYETVIDKLNSLYNHWDNLDPLLMEVLNSRENDNVHEMINSYRRMGTYSEIQLLQFLKTMIIAGSETPSSLISTSIQYLITNNLIDVVEQDEFYLTNFLEEILRLYSPGQLTYRYAATQIELCNEVIPAGSLLAVSIGAANRDPSIFERPDEFQINRNNQNTLSFGKGIHFCVGSHVGKLAAQVFIKTFIKYFDGVTVENSPIKYADSPQVYRIAELKLHKF